MEHVRANRKRNARLWTNRFSQPEAISRRSMVVAAVRLQLQLRRNNEVSNLHLSNG
jgi:hypothetical protein